MSKSQNHLCSFFQPVNKNSLYKQHNKARASPLKCARFYKVLKIIRNFSSQVNTVFYFHLSLQFFPNDKLHSFFSVQEIAVYERKVSQCCSSSTASPLCCGLFYFWGWGGKGIKGESVNLKSISWLQQLASKLLVCSCVHVLSLKLQAHALWVLENQTKVLMLI